MIVCHLTIPQLNDENKAADTSYPDFDKFSKIQVVEDVKNNSSLNVSCESRFRDGNVQIVNH